MTFGKFYPEFKLMRREGFGYRAFIILTNRYIRNLYSLECSCYNVKEMYSSGFICEGAPAPYPDNFFRTKVS